MNLVSKLALAAVMTIGTVNPAFADNQAADTGVPGPEQDPHIWLEEARGEKALEWVKAENERTLGLLTADPRFEHRHVEVVGGARIGGAAEDDEMARTQALADVFDGADDVRTVCGVDGA